MECHLITRNVIVILLVARDTESLTVISEKSGEKFYPGQEIVKEFWPFDPCRGNVMDFFSKNEQLVRNSQSV